MVRENQGIFSASFLWEPIEKWDQFIPEEMTPEQKEFAKVARDFAKNEVQPNREEIDVKKNKELPPKLLKKSGELGLLMAEVPENYGGLGLDKKTATIIAENITGWCSFIVPFMCHTGIGTLPILYYGTEEQKKKYLPKLASGEFLGAYALTEAGSGSDALAAKTKAVLSPDKKFYILNGEKQFITNGGFADLFTVFAKVDGEKFTAFIVEKNTEGLSHGKEEQKMGIHGSSTVPLILQDCKVPVENVLGEVGKGHHIAFNVLNVGRWKLGAACMGSSKRILEYSAKYLKERKQFGKPISSFQTVRTFLANDCIRTYLAESLVYAYASALDDAVKDFPMSDPNRYKEVVKKIKGLNIEASITKVFCSEALFFNSDDAVQMYGGYGYIQDYPAEQFYRDNRINRIFEGTNEINRLLIPGSLIRRSMKGSIDLMSAIQKVEEGIQNGFPKTETKELMSVWIDQLNSLKNLALYFGGAVVQKYMEQLEEKQNLMVLFSDLIIETYAIECGLKRALKIQKLKGEKEAALAKKMVASYMSEKLPELKSRARQGLFNISEGNEKVWSAHQAALDKIVDPQMVPTESFKEEIAACVLEKEGYIY
ncbi:MAG: acyl-CoA dehydrogenase family protein [Deltaproteobacteria bacterium]|nr:acyl-CoA dehydrogenase family protein [Deltaproteobacteria bacterium]